MCKQTKNTIDLQRGYLNKQNSPCYSVPPMQWRYCRSRSTSSSGVMFDALAHGLPFISTDLNFFKEFAAQGLGISVKRNASEFSKALNTLANNYDSFAKAVETLGKR